MTEQTNDQNNSNDDGQNQDGSKPNWRRDLEERAKKGDEALTALTALQRKDVARDLGLDTKLPLVQMFLKGYDGEVTEDAMREAATEVGLLQASADGGTQATTEGQPEGQPNPVAAQMDQITRAAGSPANQPPDVGAELEKAYDSGGSEALLDQVEKFGATVTTRQ